MAARFGHIKQFEPDSDSITAYLERVQLYFIANNVAEEKQVPILLSAIGSSTNSLMSDLLAPDFPGTKSFAEILASLRRHFKPKSAERFHFHKRDQVGEETMAEYDAALRKLAIHCNFGQFLEDALRD